MLYLKRIPEWFIFLFSTILFVVGYYIGFAEVMIGLFTFLIIMEIVRTIYEYMFNPESRMKVRYIIDSAIFFGIRESFVGWLMLKTNLELGLVIMVVSIMATGAFIFFRRKVIESSPDKIEKCYEKEEK